MGFVVIAMNNLTTFIALMNAALVHKNSLARLVSKTNPSADRVPDPNQHQRGSLPVSRVGVGLGLGPRLSQMFPCKTITRC